MRRLVFAFGSALDHARATLQREAVGIARFLVLIFWTLEHFFELPTHYATGDVLVAHLDLRATTMWRKKVQ
jgi:hypothetical protein